MRLELTLVAALVLAGCGWSRVNYTPKVLGQSDSLHEFEKLVHACESLPPVLVDVDAQMGGWRDIRPPPFNDGGATIVWAEIADIQLTEKRGWYNVTVFRVVGEPLEMQYSSRYSAERMVDVLSALKGGVKEKFTPRPKGRGKQQQGKGGVTEI